MKTGLKRGVFFRRPRLAFKAMLRRFFFAGLLATAVLAHTAAQGFPSLEADPRAAELADLLAGGGRQYWHNLAEAALWASSVNRGAGAEEKARQYLGRIDEAAAQLAAAPDLPAGARERGEYILTFIHKTFLKSYSERQTRVDEIFVSGRYNCVSSAVLYAIFALSVGLEAGGGMTKDHAFAAVRAGTEMIDVETTNPYGFDPGNKKEFHDGFGKVTGFAYVPARNYRDRAAVNPLELTSLILSNRIAELESQNRFSESIPLGINRAVLLSRTGSGSGERAAFFADPRRDMMERLYNYAAHLIRTNKEDEALAWVEYAGRRYPGVTTAAGSALGGWQSYVLAAVNNKLVKLLRSRKDGAAAARSYLESKKEILAGDYRQLDSMVLEAELVELVNNITQSGDVEAALVRIAAAGERLPEKARTELRVGAVLQEGGRLSKSGDWVRIISWLSGAITQYGSDGRLESALRQARQNRISVLHNEFAQIYNKKDYAGACSAAQRGLEEFPESDQLFRDLQLAERQLKR